MNKKEQELIKKYITFAQNRIISRCSGAIRDALLRELNNALLDLEASFKKETKKDEQSTDK